jgi:hypothetical protein
MFLCLGVLGLGIMAGASRAEDGAPPGPNDAAAIEMVIRDQMAAFRRDDAAGAFAFASPGIRRQFGTAATFMALVQGGYPAVYRPREVEFRELRPEGGRIVQDVFVVGPDGVPTIARYFMERQPDGVWRIDGCVMLKAPDQDV